MHGFGVRNRGRDEFGNPRETWTPRSLTRFENLQNCFINQYKNFRTQSGFNVGVQIQSVSNAKLINGL